MAHALTDDRRRDRSRLLPWSPVAVVVLFNLVVLRPELLAAQTPNDFGMHLSMVRWASERIGAGHLPFDGWYPYLSLGSPQASQYPTLAHDVVGVLGQVFDAATTMRWSAYLLLATWPVAVYLGARLADLDRWQAACAAAASPFLASTTSYGLELSSYVWRGYGIWPQIWAQWLLPIAWGLAWRAIGRRGPLWLAALAVAATFALHFVTGYVCVVGVAAMVLAGPLDLRALAARLGRAALVGVGFVATVAYVLVPLLEESRWANFPGLDRNTVAASTAAFGPGKALGWLVSGELYDAGRLPVLTVLVAVGLVCCIRRHRGVVLVWATTFLVFAFGAQLGPLDRLLPGSSDLFTRFVIGVHLAGLLALGVGAAEIGRRVLARLPGALTPEDEDDDSTYRALAIGIVVVAALVCLSPAWRWAIDYEGGGHRFITEQRAADATDGAQLDSLLAKVHDGRVYAGSATSWGADYRVGYTPVYVWLDNKDVDALGYWYRLGSLSTEVETGFLDAVPAHYPLFGVRYLLLPTDRQPSPGIGAELVATAGRHSLWEVSSGKGYLGVVDTTAPPIVADRKSLGEATLPFLASTPAKYPTVAFDGGAAEPPTDPTGAATGIAGEVVEEDDVPADGRFAGTVTMARRAAVVLRASYSGKWVAEVDGEPAGTYMVAPSYAAVTVPAGRHTVTFTYQTSGSYLVLLLVGAAALVGLAVYDRRSRRTTAPPS